MSEQPDLSYIAEPLRHLAIPIGELVFDPANARKHGEKNLRAIKGALRQFGQRMPIVVQRQGMIVRAGNGRLQSAIDLGWTHIAAVIMDESDAAAIAFAIADNRTAELAEWDDPTLEQLLRVVEVGDEELQQMFADLAQDEGLIFEDDGSESEEAPEAEVDRADELRQKWGTASGQLWLIHGKAGTHRLLCGDSTNGEDVARLMDGKKAGCVVTDPPYGMEFVSNYRSKRHQPISGDGGVELLLHACTIEADHSRYVFCRWDNIPDVPPPTSLITWVKNNWSMGDLEHSHARQTEVILFYPGSNHRWVNGRPADVLNHARTENELHPTVKPVPLLVDVIKWTDGLIYEPFCGSGTTIIAAENLGRLCFACELSPGYIGVILERCEKAGMRPELESVK